MGCAVRHADLVIINAKVWTGEPADSDRNNPISAIAVVGDRIAKVGSLQEIQPFINPDTQTVDAEGRRVIPGLIDCHTHIINAGLQLSQLQLREVPDRQNFVDQVAAEVQKLPAGDWVLGGRWSVESWPDPSQPTKGWIDPISPNNPVYLTRMDGHQALANSAALKLAGIDANGPPDPPGGQIDREPGTNQPTGILRDSAMGLVAQLIPKIDAQLRDQALLNAMRHANRYGVTAVDDMCEPHDLESFRRIRASGQATVRIHAFLTANPWTEHFTVAKGFDNDNWVTVGGFKGYMDGSLGSRTAYMHERYADADPNDKNPAGLLAAAAEPPERMREAILTADAEGFQLAVHAIGDKANALLLDFFENAALRNGPRNRRHRSEHAQHLTRNDIGRFFQLGVYASMQPFHKADDGRYASEALGEKRVKTSYAFRDLQEAGAWVCFGSDWPVVTVNPFAGIASAVNARTLDGKTWVPEQSLTVENALRAYTWTAAQASFREELIGSIQVGKLADFAILDLDPLQIDPDDLADVRVDMTIVGGKVVWDAQASDSAVATRKEN